MTRYEKSEMQLVRAEKTIPLGSQTFSKSRTQYAVGISPLYVSKAKGCHVWDLDGNKYIDLVSSLASITLGYGNKRVNDAVQKQLKLGVSFSLPAILESQVSELICELVPSAEMVRFGKNGTDATSAAVRLARAYTGRDHVVVCGYHGWQDWYIGTTSRNKGVPNSISELTHTFTYNNLESLQSIFDSGIDIACIVMEPMNSTYPTPGFLEGVREIATKYGAVLVFDETITGFRFAKGGAQEFFGVTPDVSTFGKGIANGFPLSAVVGKREIMMEMENIFFSGTFGGELLSLAAAREVLQIHTERDIPGELAQIGVNIKRGIEIKTNNLPGQIPLSFKGNPSWYFLNWEPNDEFSPEEIRTYFHQEIYKKGILVLSTHNINLALKPKVIEEITEAYSLVMNDLVMHLNKGSLRNFLEVKPLAPLFKVR